MTLYCIINFILEKDISLIFLWCPKHELLTSAKHVGNKKEFKFGSEQNAQRTLEVKVQKEFS